MVARFNPRSLVSRALEVGPYRCRCPSSVARLCLRTVSWVAPRSVLAIGVQAGQM